MSGTLPAFFVGHGNPMYALQQNAYTDGWKQIGEQIPRPRAILAISAHWFLPGTGVTISTSPRTIHDFGGFPRELYQVKYPAPGDPILAENVRRLLAPTDVQLDASWGLDHGTWSVLKHMYPNADIPVVQLQIDATQPAEFHFDLGRRLAPLRDDGVLILGSGNLVHNLRAYSWDQASVGPYDWAIRFEKEVREMIVAGVTEPLFDIEKLGRDAKLSVPTPEHYLPLLYTLGTSQTGEKPSFPIEGTDGGSISMLSMRVG